LTYEQESIISVIVEKAPDFICHIAKSRKALSVSTDVGLMV